MESPEKAEQYVVTWWEKLIDTLTRECDLPAKFYLSGHSAGGYQIMLYASYHPERIEAMFLQSPACIENEKREGWVYDPYSLRVQDQTDVQFAELISQWNK